jgi:hypothetical protein
MRGAAGLSDTDRPTHRFSTIRSQFDAFGNVWKRVLGRGASDWSTQNFTYGAVLPNGIRPLVETVVTSAYPGLGSAAVTPRRQRFTVDAVGRRTRVELAVDAATGGTFTRDDVAVPHAPLPPSRGAETSGSGTSWALIQERTFDGFGNVITQRGGGIVQPCATTTYDVDYHAFVVEAATATSDCAATLGKVSYTWKIPT